MKLVAAAAAVAVAVFLLLLAFFLFVLFRSVAATAVTVAATTAGTARSRWWCRQWWWGGCFTRGRVVRRFWSVKKRTSVLCNRGCRHINYGESIMKVTIQTYLLDIKTVSPIARPSESSVAWGRSMMSCPANSNRTISSFSLMPHRAMIRLCSCVAVVCDGSCNLILPIFDMVLMTTKKDSVASAVSVVSLEAVVEVSGAVPVAAAAAAAAVVVGVVLVVSRLFLDVGGCGVGQVSMELLMAFLIALHS